MTPLRTHLLLGRVSNLPTVWTNALAGAALAGFALSAWGLLGVMLALTLLYLGGMYLNDAFDAGVDARERPSRPIPAGAISRGAVFAIGLALLAAGVALAFALGPGPGAAGAALAAAVLLYDWSHKRTPLAPLVMGACRFLCYAVAALVAGGLTGAVVIGALGLFAHVVGLTYAARQEAYDQIDRAWPLAVLAVPVLVGLGMTARPEAGWPAYALIALYAAWSLWCVRLLFRRRPGDVPRAVVGLIAGIALYDAAIVAALGAPLIALAAVAGFLATLALQRLAPGT